MFTRCTSCMTVFHITAAELRAADGTVICGACGTTFDALESLSETRPKDSPVLAAEPRNDAVSAPPVESAAELDEQARDEDEFLEELESLIGGEGFLDEHSSADAVAGESDPPAAPAVAALSEAPPGEDTSEAHDAPDEDEFLVEDFEADIAAEESRFDQSLILDEALEPAHDEQSPEGPPLAAVAEDDELDDPFLDPDSVFRIDEELDDGDDAIQRTDAAAAEDTAGWHDADEPREDQGDLAADSGGVFAWRDADRVRAGKLPDKQAGSTGPHRVADAPESGAESEAVEETAATDTAAATEPLPEFAQRAGTGRRWPRIVVAVIAVLLLTGTWTHSQRGKLLRHPLGEALLVPAYRLLGMEVAPDWNPAEFRAVQWQAIADAERPDDLAVAVEFMNMATYAQPYPVIRIVLEDRFGRRVGTHDVPPGQYLRDHSRGSRMAGGARLQTTVEVLDPGGRADGFRVDFCLELEGQGLVCGPEPFR